MWSQPASHVTSTLSPTSASVGSGNPIFMGILQILRNTMKEEGREQSGTPNNPVHNPVLVICCEQHEDDCLFCKMLFFHQKFIGWQLLCLASADSCEVCNNVNHKTDSGHVSMTSNLPGSPGKTGDDKKLVKSVNRGNWITLVERHRTDRHRFPFLFQRTPLKYHSL